MKTIDKFKYAVRLRHSTKKEDINKAMEIFHAILTSDNLDDIDSSKAEIYRQLAKCSHRLEAYDQAIEYINLGLKVVDDISIDWCALKVLEAEVSKYTFNEMKPEIYYSIYERFESNPNHFFLKALIGLGNTRCTNNGSTQSDWYLKAIDHAFDDNN